MSKLPLVEAVHVEFKWLASSVTVAMIASLAARFESWQRCRLAAMNGAAQLFAKVRGEHK